MKLTIDYNFKDNSLFKQAMTHPSVCKNLDITSYETLEFLGDNVINLIAAEIVYTFLAGEKEGKMSQLHANMIKTNTLAKISKDIGIDKEMIISYGEEKNNGRNNDRNLENCLEALAGAIVIDSDFPTAKKIFKPLFIDFITNNESILKKDAKSFLQEWAQKKGLPLPNYKIIAEHGPEHQKEFEVDVSYENYVSSQGIGENIKSAQSKAAENFIKNNNLNTNE